MKRSVLIVDDVADIRTMLRYMIEKGDDFFIVAEAADGIEAVEKYREHLPDITIMDIEMPYKTGVEAAREIRELSEEARIIFCSARVSNCADALAIDGHTMLPKPFLPSQLLKAMSM